MNILVCLKVVSKETLKDSISDNQERLSGELLDINPADKYGLEKALCIKESTPGTVVTVVTMAPDSGTPILKQALAMGADHALHICDQRLAGADTLVTAKVLAKAITLLPKQDMIICGRKALDSETGHIGPQLAQLLGLPLATCVLDIHYADNKAAFTCARDGCVALYEGELPAIFTICNGTDMVRQPTIMGIRKSNTMEIERIGLDQLDLLSTEVGLAGSPTRVTKIDTIPFRRGKGRKQFDAKSGAAALLEMLEDVKEGP